MGALSRSYTSYSIRHRAATHLLCQKVPVYAVACLRGWENRGHSSEKITERCSRFIPDDLEDAMSLLE